MKNLFGVEEPARIQNIKNRDGSLTINPCIAVYGKGPEGAKCKTCEHLTCKAFAKKYYKCAFRKSSASPATDHRVNFPSCGKYQKKDHE